MNHTHRNSRSTGRTVWTLIICAFLIALAAGCGDKGANGNTPAEQGSGNASGASGGNQAASGDQTNGITDPETADPGASGNGSDSSNDGGNKGGSGSNDASSNGSGNGSAGQNDDGSGQNADDANSAPPGGDQADNGAVRKAEGTFVGLADTHSAEITMNDEATVFQFNDELFDQLESMKENTHVAVEYVEKDIDVGKETVTQLWLQKVQTLD